MAELFLDGNKFKIKHDGKIYSIPEMREHFRNNGHEPETIGFGLPYGKYYNLAGKVTQSFRDSFKDKYSRRNLRY